MRPIELRQKWPRKSLGKMKIYGVFSLFTDHISQLSVVSAQVFVYCHLIYSVYFFCVAHGPLNCYSTYFIIALSASNFMRCYRCHFRFASAVRGVHAPTTAESLEL